MRNKVIAEAKELATMPYFWVRFIALGLTLAFDDIAMCSASYPAFPFYIVVLSVSAAVFFVFEFLTLKKLGFPFKIRPLPAILFALFCSLNIISEIIHKMPFNSIIITVIMLIFLLAGQEKRFFNMFLLSCGFAVIGDIVMGVVRYPFISNTYSLSLASLIPVLLCAIAWILLNYDRFHIKTFVAAMLLISIMLYLSGISGGRTGFVTIIATMIFFIIGISIKFHVIRKNIDCKPSVVNFALVLCVVLVIALTVSGIIIIDDMGKVSGDFVSIENKGVLEKFVAAIKNGDVFTHRGMIWKHTLRHIKLFGNGPDFYSGAPNLIAGQNSAHNTYLAVLGHFGLLSFIVFMVFCVYMLILSVRHCLSQRKLAIFPFTMLVCYFVAGITEDLIFVVSPRLFSILFYAACAFLIVNTTKRDESIAAETEDK